MFHPIVFLQNSRLSSPKIDDFRLYCFLFILDFHSNVILVKIILDPKDLCSKIFLTRLSIINTSYIVNENLISDDYTRKWRRYDFELRGLSSKILQKKNIQDRTLICILKNILLELQILCIYGPDGEAKFVKNDGNIILNYEVCLQKILHNRYTR